MADDPGGPVDLDVEITDDRTVITLSGERDAAVVVRSASGEQIYLPPDTTEFEPRSTYDSPYQSAEGTSDSPYQSATARRTEPGLEPTADGFRIVHPEPVIDLRLLR